MKHPHLRQLVLAFVCAVAFGHRTMAADPIDVTTTAEQFVYKAFHEKAKDPKAALRQYKMLDDEDTESGKALRVKLFKRLVQKDKFYALRTPGLKENLGVGTYRATVRVKVQGMLNTLGSAIQIVAGRQKRDVYMNEFLEEDNYQEFTLDFEVREPDVITGRDNGYKHKSGWVGTILFKEDMPAIDERLKLNRSPWRDRFAYFMAARTWRKGGLKEEQIPELAKAIKAAMEANPGQLLTASKDNSLLNEKVVEQINLVGAEGSNGSVTLLFPKNSTVGLKGTRGPATPQPTLRHMVVDSIRIQQLPEPDNIVVRQVSTAAPWRRPGEDLRFMVWLHNRSGKAQKNTLKLELRSGLTHVEQLHEQSIELAPGQYQVYEWNWSIPKTQRLWGQTAIARIEKDGAAVSEERTWFTIHQFSNATMIHDKGNASRFRHPYAAPPRLQNHRELFGATCTPYDSAGVVPEPDIFWEPYSMGNGTGMMSIATLYQITNTLHQEGVAPFFYCEQHGTANKAFEMYWNNPDWIYKKPANTDEFLLERVRTTNQAIDFYKGKLKTKDNKPPMVSRAGGAYHGQGVAINGIVTELVDAFIRDVLKLMEHTSFAGFRGDGIPMRAHNGKALGGDWGKTKEEIDAISVANLKRIKKEVRAKYPHFELRANAGVRQLEEKQEDPYDFDKAFEIFKEADPLQVELVRGHGSVMEEMWMHYSGFGAYTNNCRNYLRACHFENAAFKMAGGHNGHMLWFYDGTTQYTPDEIYQQLFTVLGGAHMDGALGPIVESVHEFGAYAARFSEYFWDPDLRPIYDMADKVSVDADADLWYTETGFEKTIENGNRILVVPIFNPPVTELWLQNRFGLLPTPITEPIGMNVQAPEGYSKVAAVYLLENSPYPMVKPLEFEDNDGEAYFEFPELHVFEVAVIEFSK